MPALLGLVSTVWNLKNKARLVANILVLQALITLSVEELCEAAESLVAPVRMGVAKPTSSYPLFSVNLDIVNGSNAAFARLPFPPR